MEQIAVIGAGTMGNGIAHVFAQHGYKVHLIDLSGDTLAKAINKIAKNLDRQIKKGTLIQSDKPKILSRISTFTDLQEAVEKTDFAIEAATENEQIKLELFKNLSAFAPADALLASNTSSISITKIAAATGRPEKVIGMHFM